MKELHLFAGAGGGILGGLALGHVCIGAVEIEPYCQAVLQQRQVDGALPNFPIFGDIKEFNGYKFKEKYGQTSSAVMFVFKYLMKVFEDYGKE